MLCLFTYFRLVHVFHVFCGYVMLCCGDGAPACRGLTFNQNIEYLYVQLSRNCYCIIRLTSPHTQACSHTQACIHTQAISTHSGLYPVSTLRPVSTLKPVSTLRPDPGMVVATTAPTTTQTSRATATRGGCSDCYSKVVGGRGIGKVGD